MRQNIRTMIGGKVFVIAEIGQNHNGRKQLALDLITMAALPIYHNGKLLPGVDAVKMCKRDLSEECTAEAMAAPYENENSFGKTYGEHRAALELTYQEHFECYQYAKSKGLRFVETVCSIKALNGILDLFVPDALKIASRDMNNYPLLTAIGKTGLPIIMSTGIFREREEINRAISALNTDNLAILHCTSIYPTWYEDADMTRIYEYKKIKVNGHPIPVGYSDHTNGVLSGSIATCFGACILEKHITPNREMRGTDHAGSLDYEGLRRYVRDVRNTETALKGGMRSKELIEKAKKKLGRGLAVNKDLKKGHVLRYEDVILLSPEGEYQYLDVQRLIGLTLARDISAMSHLKRIHFYA